MRRLRHFAKNVGILGILQTLIVSVAVAWLTYVCTTVRGPNVLPLLVTTTGFGLPYLLRDRLVDRFDIVRPIMAVAFVSMLVFAQTARSFELIDALPEAGQYRLCLGMMFVLSVYISIYYWMLSDLRISKE